jgi:sigma-B regulation protein RsbU (phosphoserine phosphatase)
MQQAATDLLRRQLEDRRRRLSDSIEREGPDADLVRLLRQVDSALGRMDTDEYAVCLVCHEHVDEKDLRLNPLMEYCLCGMSPEQQRALQNDLGLARRIQAALLPDPDLSASGWEASYRYEPAGVVSGDYCDLWTRPGEEGVYFAVGDVSGKGIAASLLMAHLQSALRSLAGTGLPLADLAVRVNQQLLEAAIPTHYATLAFGRAEPDGRIRMVNAGHCPPLVLRGTTVERIGPTGFPIGLLSERPYDVVEIELGRGDALVLYTDGLTEARVGEGEAYGEERMEDLLASRAGDDRPRGIVGAVRADLDAFLAGAKRADDLTLLAMKRAA